MSSYIKNLVMIYVDQEYSSLQEEVMNTITHGIAAIVSMIGLIFLIIRFARTYDDNIVLAGGVIFGLTAFITFVASTLYHSAAHKKLKHIFKLIDHAAIYLLIAGTYTPFALGNLRNEWGLVILVLIWTLAIGGILYKFIAGMYWDRFPSWDAFVYVGLGCVIIFFINPVLQTVEPGGVALLVAGGLMYLIGVFFFLWQNLPYNHSIWHLFVIAGATFHYFSIFYYVMPPA